MKIRIIIALIFFLAVSVVYDVLLPGIEGLSSWILWILYLIFPVGATLIGIYTSRIYGFKSANGRAVLLIIIGSAFWVMSNVSSFVLETFFHTNEFAFSPLSDAFIMLGYPIIAAGLYQGFVAAGINLKTVKKSLLAIVISASVVLTVLVLYFVVYQAYDSNADTITNTVNIGYGLADLVLMIGSLFTVLVANEYKGGKLASFWKTMAVGIFILLIGDVLFAMYGDLAVEGIRPYAYIDLIYMAAWAILAFGLLENYLNIYSVQITIKLKLKQRQ